MAAGCEMLFKKGEQTTKERGREPNPPPPERGVVSADCSRDGRCVKGGKFAPSPPSKKDRVKVTHAARWMGTHQLLVCLFPPPLPSS